MNARHSSPLAGIGFVLLAVACFATLDTTTKIIATAVPVAMALCFRYAFQAVATTLIFVPLRGRAVFRTRHPRFQLLRGALLLSTSAFAFFSLKFMPVGEFTSIVMIVPLVVTLLAATTLGEKVSPLRWILVTGGFVGTMIIIRPGSDDFSWAMLLPLGLVASNAWFQVLTSRLAQTEDPITMHIYSGWVGTILTAVVLPFVWVTPTEPVVWMCLLLMGLMGSVGHFLFIMAYKRAPASTITPYAYMQIGFAMLGGWLVFSHIPDRYSLMGIGLIAVCGAIGGWLTVRESRIAVQPAES